MTDDAPEHPQSKQSSDDPELIVGVGASAGGLDAFREFVKATPPDSRLAYVFVSHLDPSHESLLADVLRKDSPLPIRQITSDQRARAGNVYVIPPNRDLELNGGFLRLLDQDLSSPVKHPIDRFFHSLAEDCGENAVAVILSGTGTDGSTGIRSIKERGGLLLAQTEVSAQYGGMPVNAAATGLIDEILPVEEMPEYIANYAASRQTLQQKAGGETAFWQQLGAKLPEICNLLRSKTGHDFTHYKRNTLIRRTLRRLQVLRVSDLGQYICLLADDDKETQALLKELLITVTQFFRDPEAFESLKKNVIPQLIKRSRESGELRVWVPACATGEEAYTIAILIMEAMEAEGHRGSLQIFGTDIDETALAKARFGKYGSEVLEQVGEARVKKFFTQVDDGYRINSEVRDRCIFSLQDLTRDPPFSRIDLLSCRNLLIYLDNVLQQKVAPLFHYAMTAGGYLMLGTSENLPRHLDLFSVVDKENRIFQWKRSATARLELPSLTRMPDRHSTVQVEPTGRRSPVAFETQVLHALAHEHSPPCAVVNTSGDILYLTGNVGRFLRFPPGLQSHRIIDLARGALSLELRALLHHSARTNEAAIREGVGFATEDGERSVRLTVRPLAFRELESPLLLVIFEEEADPIRPAPSSASSVGQTEVIQHLETELRNTKEDLRSTIEELETSNEELKSTNEELLSTNEELQSSNQELQTSREELQSINEELETVNSQLRSKVTELDAAHSDLQNLFECTDIATVFVDSDFCIKKFTPAARDIFSLIPADVGRPLTDLANRFVDHDLGADLRAVAEEGRARTLNIEVRGAEPRTLRTKIMPYRTLSGDVNGMVITLVDITSMIETQHLLELRAQQQETIAKAAVLVFEDPSLEKLCREMPAEIAACFPNAVSILYRCSEPHGHLIVEQAAPPLPGFSVPKEYDCSNVPHFTRLLEGSDLRHVALDDVSVLGEVAGIFHNASPAAALEIPIRDGESPWGILGLYLPDKEELNRDQTSFVRTIGNLFQNAARGALFSQRVQEAKQRLDLALEAGEMGAWEWSINRNEVYWSPAVYRLLELPEEQHDTSSDFFLEHIHPDDRAHHKRKIEEAVRSEGSLADEFRVTTHKGNPRTLAVRAAVTRDKLTGELKMFGVNYDITAKRQWEEELRAGSRRKDEFLALLGHELRNPLVPLRHGIELLNERNDPELRDVCTIMGRQLRHITQLVDDLLDTARIAHGKIALRRSKLDLRELIKDVHGDFKEELEEIAPELKLPDETLYVEGDTVRLAQVLGNILRNAIRHTPAGGQISVALRSINEHAEIEITDSGVGMDSGTLEKIFEPFNQAGRNSPSSEGLGLGMPLARTLVELHGGKLTAKSSGPDQGSTFTVTLPLSTPPRNPSEEAPVSAVSKPRRVLIIDDHHDSLKLFRIFLESDGHEVAIASHAEEGLEAATAFNPEIVLCDIGLPGNKDGYDVGRELNDRQPRPFLVAITGYGQPKDRQLAKEAGFDVHLTKPVEPEKIRSVISTVPVASTGS